MTTPLNQVVRHGHPSCVMHVIATVVLGVLLLTGLVACGGGGGSSGVPGVAVPPAALADVIAVAGDQRAALSWEAVAGAASYSVQRATATLADGGNYLPVASGISTPNFADTGLGNGTPYFYRVLAHNAAGVSPASNEALVTPVAPLATGSVRWPLSRQSSADADSVRYPYGPRRFVNYDFHAGIDIQAPLLTPIYPVMDGVVSKVENNTDTIGAGINVVLSHAQQRRTAYLHMTTATVALGQAVTAGVTQLGTVGSTGARSNHLHFTYMVGLSSEARSKNPLEILPYAAVGTITASFRTDSSNKVDISLPSHKMTLRWIILKGEGQTRMLDYYSVVTQGAVLRNNQLQSGIAIDAAAPPSPEPLGQENFVLTVGSDPSNAFAVQRVILKDFNGSVLLDATK
jgi:murein DD-endopeptidase MepM/ murein hydrolase activator NlpD